MTTTAVVYEIRGKGLHVATLQGNTVFALGSYHEVLVFSKDCASDPSGRAARQALMAKRELAASVTDTVGLELAFGRRWTGLTLGRHQAAVMVDVPKDQEFARSLSLNLSDLSSTRLEILDDTPCKEEMPT